jgi:hypothetical protein
MSRARVLVLTGLACVVVALARPAAAQRLPSHDSLLSMMRQPRSAMGPEITCPMPIAPFNPSGVERMPVAPTDARGHYLRVVPFGCVNPLFRGPVAVLLPRRPTWVPPPQFRREHLPVPRVYLVPWR